MHVVFGQYHLHIVPLLLHRPPQRSHHVAQAALLRRVEWRHGGRHAGTEGWEGSGAQGCAQRPAQQHRPGVPVQRGVPSPAQRSAAQRTLAMGAISAATCTTRSLGILPVPPSDGDVVVQAFVVVIEPALRCGRE